MKRNTMEPTAAAAEEKLFDNWFDPIEMTLRGKVRGFLEGLMEEENWRRLCSDLATGGVREMRRVSHFPVIGTGGGGES